MHSVAFFESLSVWIRMVCTASCKLVTPESSPGPTCPESGEWNMIRGDSCPKIGTRRIRSGHFKSGHFKSGMCPDQDTSNLECVPIFRHESINEEPAQYYKGVFPHYICTFTCLVCCGFVVGV